ncbi:MAG: ileS [Rickettsiales bacterium]|jgi:isoleucyl-tRNA synthetase|nr:ileS [Rickettsiales bacterium]
MPPLSIHLTDFPNLDTLPNERELVEDMDRVRDACNAALSVRNTENIRIRQPLQKLTIVGKGAKRLAPYFPLIQDEVNVKDVALEENIEAAATYNLKINFPVLGKRLPHRIKDLIPATKQGKWERLENGQVKVLDEVLTPEECILELKPKAAKGAQALSTNDALVILDLEISDTLRLEGIARDLVRMIQQSRKEADLKVSDRIALVIETDNADITAAVEAFGQGSDYSIAEQTLAVSISIGATSALPHRFTQSLENCEITLGFRVADEKHAKSA